MAILQPHLGFLHDLPHNAWAQYHAEIPAHLLIAFCSRTRASGVHNLMVSDATRYAAVTADVRPFDRFKMKGITINGVLAIRFKKLGEDSRSRNQPSQQVRDFRNQMRLDGIPAAYNLELGYVLNEHETEITEARLVHPSGKGIFWWTRIGAPGEQAGTIELFPNQPEGPKPKPPAIGPKKKDNNIVPIRKSKQDDED